MRKVLAAAIALAGSLAATYGFACGDKFLVIGRTPRSQRAKGAVQKATILIYMEPTSALRAAIRQEGLESDLKLAGHTVRMMDDRGAVGPELRSQRYDIVLASVADADSIDAEVGSERNGPILLPIVSNPTAEELAAARRRFACVMKSPNKRQNYLGVIDDAMVLRQTRAKAEQKAKEQR